MTGGAIGKSVIRPKNGGRLDFWTLRDTIAGHGRRYHRIVIDEAAFTRDVDKRLHERHVRFALASSAGQCNTT